MKHRSNFGWLEAITGILFIAFGIYALVVPFQVVGVMVVLFGILAIVRGIGHLVFYSQFKRVSSYSLIFSIINGILDIVVGILFLSNIQGGALVISLLFPIWFIADCIFHIAASRLLKDFNTTGYTLSLIVNIIGIVLGVFLLFDPVTSLITVAYIISAYFILFGIHSLAIAYSRLGSNQLPY